MADFRPARNIAFVVPSLDVMINSRKDSQAKYRSRNLDSDRIDSLFNSDIYIYI